MRLVMLDKNEIYVFVIKILFVTLIIFSFCKLYFEISQSLSCLNVITYKNVFRSIFKAPSLLTCIGALLGILIAFNNYLRKHGNEVQALIGQEYDQHLLILINKKDKPVVFNSVCLLLDKDKYLELELKDHPLWSGSQTKFSKFFTIKPYETLILYIEERPLVSDLLENSQSYPSKVVLLAVDDHIVCKQSKIVPIQIHALQNSKKFKVLDPNCNLKK